MQAKVGWRDSFFLRFCTIETLTFMMNARNVQVFTFYIFVSWCCMSHRKLCFCLSHYFLVITVGVFLKKRKVKSLKTFNLYSRDKNCEPRGGSKQLLHHNTARRTFITRENIRIHILARTHACAHMKTNVTRNRN